METESLIYRNPKGLYQEFVNAVQRLEKRPLTKEEIKRKADAKWREIRNDQKEIQTIINSAPKPENKFRQQKIGGLFVKKGEKLQNKSNETEDLSPALSRKTKSCPRKKILRRKLKLLAILVLLLMQIAV